MKHGIIFVAWNSMRNLMGNKKGKENIPSNIVPSFLLLALILCELEVRLRCMG